MPHLPGRRAGPWRPVLITVAGTAAAIGVAARVASAELANHWSPTSTALDVMVGLAFVGGAAMASGPWRARALFGAVGFAWLLGGLNYAGVLAAALVTFPGGRASSAWRRLLIALSLMSVVAEPTAEVLAALFAAVSATAVLDRRWERAAWVFSATAAGVLACLLAGHAVAEHQQAAAFDFALWLLAHEAVLISIAAGFPVAVQAVARERLMLADRLLAQERATGLDGLAAVLAVTLDEPRLQVFRWNRGAGSYVAGDGGAAALGNARSFIAVNDGNERLAVVAHEGRAATQDPVVARAVAEAVRLAALNERWQAALDARVADLEATRMRLLDAADRQRVAIAERLLDEVVRPIESAVKILQRVDVANASLESSTGSARARAARDAFRLASEELVTSIDEVRALTDGLPPGGLGDGGLVPALRRLAERCPIPVALTLGPDVATDPAREATLFYVCSEAIANTIKHARASHVSIELRSDSGSLALVVADDGIGGASAGGYGLRGLADRLAAYGGRLRVDSPPGAGTKLTARIGI
jgi:signal transduction histidine kinase